MLSAAFVALLILLWLATVLYHLFLSPVAKIPGPRLAAITFWYEFYYDVWNKGQYTWKLKELHKQYGIFSALNSSHSIYYCMYTGSKLTPLSRAHHQNQSLRDSCR